MDIKATLRAAVEALISGERDIASAKMKDYFVAKAAPMVNTPINEAKQDAFNVYHKGKLIDTVYADGYDAAEMKKSLIDHDGYDPAITVKKRKTPEYKK